MSFPDFIKLERMYKITIPSISKILLEGYAINSTKCQKEAEYVSPV